RFRVVDITTFPPAGSAADLRVRTSTAGTVVINGNNAACPAKSCSMQATTLETPPAQPNGGGLDSSLSAGTITLAAPLVNGGTLNVNFLLGIQVTGCGTFVVIAEADTGVSSIFGANLNTGGGCTAPTAAPATISG